MPPLSVEKEHMLRCVAETLGEAGVRDVPLAVSYPSFAHQLPGYMIAVESLELHLGVPCDRVRVTSGKALKADLYLPGRDLYVELDREGHDLAPARETTFGYYPPGLPRGFEPDRHRRLIAALGAQPTSKMYNGRALVDFLKDLYVEGILGKPLVRLAKSDLSFLLGRTPDLVRLGTFLAELAERLNLPQLKP